MSIFKNLKIFKKVAFGLLIVGATGLYADSFFTVMGNIMSNMQKDPHARYVDDNMSAKETVETTGSTKEIDEEKLPQAFQPMKKFKHPPFSMGACQICHAPTKTKVAALITKTVEKLCFECHPAQTMPQERFNCNKCHSPHHASREKLLRDKVIEEECPVGVFVDPTGVNLRVKNIK